MCTPHRSITVPRYIVGGWGEHRVSRGGGCTYDIACRSPTIVDLASNLSQDGARVSFRRTRFAINHQAQSAMVCSASPMKGELYSAKIARREAY